MQQKTTLGQSPAMGRTAVYAVSFSLVLNMAGYLSVAAILPTLIDRWHLTEVEAGWLASCHIGVYAVAAILLLPLTDRLNVQRMIVLSLLAGAVGGLGFAWLADGFWSGVLFRALVGIAQAGVYMPGLKLIADGLQGSERAQATALYSSMVPIGSGLSLWLPSAPLLADEWRLMFVVTGLACLVGCALMLFLVPSRSHASATKAKPGSPYAFRDVFNNMPVMRYIVSYAGHTWETFAFRAWVVTFFGFSATRSIENGEWMPELTSLAALIIVVAAPASMVFGRWCARRGFDRPLRMASITSLLVSFLLASFVGDHPYLVFAMAAVYGIVGFADQGALGSAVIEASDPEARGSTLAVYTLFGFGFGMLGAVAGGFVLHAFGGIHNPFAWQMLWITCGGGALLTSLMVWLRPSITVLQREDRREPN
jgi:MFS family permease